MQGRTATTRTVALKPHPACPESLIERLSVRMERDGVALWLRFVAEGFVNEVRWPAPVEPGRADDLWRHTCFEAFVATEDDGYVEYNLSPSRQWAAYRFDGPRTGMRMADETATVSLLEITSDLATLEACVQLPQGVRRLGLSAVIEITGGASSYWALAHPSAKPDFHHPDSFILELP